MEAEPPDIHILRRQGDWRWIENGDIVRAAALAWAAAGPSLPGAAATAAAAGIDINILLADDAFLRDLNLRFRGRDEPTDILSFPAHCFDGARCQLGDVAFSEQAVLRGAEARGKSRREHLLHLTVHGVLHLCGHEHQQAGEARAMEALETAALAQMSIADPYCEAAAS